MHYTTILAIVCGIAGVTLLALSFIVWLRVDSHASYWSNKKIWLFWSPAVAGVVCVIIAIAAPYTAFTEHRKTERGLGDGPRFPTEMIDGRPVDGITEMADNFPNVATKCVWDGFRAFVTSNGDMLAVVVDETCRYVATGPDGEGER